MQIDMNDKQAIEQTVNALTKNDDGNIFIPLLKSQKYILEKKYHKSKSSIKEVFCNPNINQNTVLLIASIISRVNDEAGLKVILLGARNELLAFWFKNENLPKIKEFFEKLKFQKNSSPNYLKAISKYLIGFFANKAYQQKKIDLAFFFEQEIYTNFITGVETEKAFQYGMQLTLEEAEKAGRHNQSKINDFEYNNDLPQIGFFFHSASMLAHISNIYSFLEVASKRSFPDFVPFVFCLGGRHEEFQQKFSKIGVKIIYLDINDNQSPIPSVANRLLFLKEKCRSLKIDKIVWGCLASMLPYTFALRVAKEQIWWSQKWQSLNAINVDKYIWSYNMNTEQFLYGRIWKCGWFQQNSWLSSSDSQNTQNYRDNFQGKIILGSLARTDKLRNHEYLDVICEILNKHENTVYLWAGREEDAFVKSKFQAAGIYSKTKFIGWVDTNQFSNVFDILLDTFPIGNGSTALQAMEAGTPVLIFKSSEQNKTLDQLTGSFLSKNVKENEYTHKTKLIFSNSDMGDLYTCASNAGEYLELADKLIVDTTFREAVGKAYAKFIRELMTTPDTSYDIFTDHLLS